MIDIVFVMLALFALAGGVGMISFRQPIHSALSLIISILALAGIFAILSASFLFMVQIIVYAGAVITLVLFIIMFLNIKTENLPEEKNKKRLFVIGSIALIPFNILIIKAFSTLPSKPMGIKEDGFGNIKPFGEILFYNWLVPFELISLLLLTALIGAVVYARKGRGDG